MDIRKKIKELIESKAISIRQLSETSGVRRQSIMHFLSGGNLHLNNLEKILHALSCEISISATNPSSDESTNLLQAHLSFDIKSVRKFCQKKGIRYLAIFGSVLRDDFKEESDIDIVIELKKSLTFFELEDIEEDLKKLFKTKHKLDVVTVNSISPLLIDEIMNTSEVIYDEAA